MKINFSLKSFAERARNNVSALLYAALGLILIAEGFVVHTSLSILLDAKRVPTIQQNTSVRVNFTQYDAITKRLDAQKNFRPTPVTTKTPFGILAEPKPTTP